MLRSAFPLAVAFALLLPSARAAAEARTLDEVEIEGEVRLPQVLFITSRESERPLDFLDAFAGPDAAEIAATAWRPPNLYPVPAAEIAAGPAGPPPAVPSDGAAAGTEPATTDDRPSANQEGLR
jgi:hypothetical protein